MRVRFCLLRSRSAAFMHSHLKELHGRRSSDDQHTSDLRGLANPRPCRLDFSTEAALSALRSSGPGQRARPPPRVVRRLLARIHRHLSAGADTRWAWAGVLQGATARVCLSREGSQCQASQAGARSRARARGRIINSRAGRRQRRSAQHRRSRQLLAACCCGRSPAKAPARGRAADGLGVDSPSLGATQSRVSSVLRLLRVS